MASIVVTMYAEGGRRDASSAFLGGSMKPRNCILPQSAAWLPVVLIVLASASDGWTQDAATRGAASANRSRQVTKEELPSPAEKRLSEYVGIYEKRLVEMDANTDKRLTEINSHVEQRFAALESLIKFAALILAAVTALISWLGYRTVAQWIKQAIELRVKKIVTVAFVESLVTQQSGPAVNKIMTDFRRDAAAALEEVQKQQKLLQEISSNIGKTLSPAQTETLTVATNAADAKPAAARSADDWTVIAYSAFSKAQFAAALDAAQRALALGVSDARLGIAAISAQYANHPDTAERYFRLLLQRSPNDASTLARYGSFLQTKRRDFDGAESYYRRALAADPESYYAYDQMGQFLSNVRKDDDGADAMFTRAVELAPQSPLYLLTYARFLQNKRKDLNKAESLYRRAYEAGPKDPASIIPLAQFLFSVRHDETEAKKLVDAAIALNPTDSEGSRTLGRLLWIMKQSEKAELFLRRATVSEDSRPADLVTLGDFLSAQGRDVDEAESLYRRAIEMDPSYGTGLASLAELLWLQRKDLDQAEQYFELAKDAPMPTTWGMRAYARFKMQARLDYDGAEALYRHAAQFDAEAAESLAVDLQGVAAARASQPSPHT